MKNCIVISLITLSGLVSYHVLAQTTDTTTRHMYIREYPGNFYLKPILTIRNLSLNFHDKNRQISRIVYNPSSSNYFGLGVYAFDLGLELSFKLPQDSEERPSDIYGTTESFDLQTNIYSKKWGADISLQKYNGMYLDKPANHITSWKNGDPFPQRSDLTLSYLQLNAFYIFNNERFSYRSAFNQADRQLKSSGSLLLGMFISTFRFSGDSTLIPVNDQAFFEDQRDINFGRITTLAIVPGYTYNFIYNKFYFNLSLSIGPGHVWVRHKAFGIEREEIAIKPVINLRTALGYNSDTFFGGISLVNQTITTNISNMEISGGSGNVKIFIGYRFQEFGILKKSIL